MTQVDSFSSLMDMAADPKWRDEIFAAAEAASPLGGGVEPDIYLAAFSTPAGRAVLRDLHDRYVNTARWVPGEDVSSGYYREGAAQLVFFIAAMLEAAAIGENPQDANEG